MLRRHVAFYLPKVPAEMVVAEALDARLMIASALEDLAQFILEEGRPLPVPSHEAHDRDADLIELVPLSIQAGMSK